MSASNMILDPSSDDGNHSMRIWDAGFVVAAVLAVTRDKKPVTDPFLSGREYLSNASASRHV
ncbi:hypothetical protein [Bradyrhizobium sp. B117]|uniref:hypothetical protein n=1 Tax=Bradyrhizobium sp. B117 TaxID=3140246 RepID=UPI0031835BEC